MKKLFKLGFAVALAALVFSCSNLEIKKHTSIKINIPVKNIVESKSNQSLARSLDSTETAIEEDNSTYELKIVLNVDGKDFEQSAWSTIEELSAKVFTFSDLEVGATVFARCEVLKKDVLMWSGKSEPKVISEGANDIEIIMKHEHVFSNDWMSDETHHWHVCSCGEVDGKEEHKWNSSDTCVVCGMVKITEVEIEKLVEYLSDISRKDTTPTVKVKANSNDDITSIKNALTDESVTSNVAGVNLVLKTDSLTSLPESAFEDCTVLTSVTIPENVKEIGENVFSSCTSLKSVTIPEGVTSIGGYAFCRCRALTSVTIPEDVKEIGGYAFTDCTALLSVTIPSSVTSIGSSVFDGCTSLTSVTIPEGVTSIGEHAFDGCTSLTSVTIPSSVTSIGNSAFIGCTSLTSVTILEGVESIGNSAFTECTALTSVTIPSSVTSIGEGAFGTCENLKSVTIPSSVTSIGDFAFYQCTALSSVTVEAEEPPTLGTDAFADNAEGRKIYVPSASVSTYKEASGWSDYANDIQGITTP